MFRPVKEKQIKKIKSHICPKHENEPLAWAGAAPVFEGASSDFDWLALVLEVEFSAAGEGSGWNVSFF